MIQKNSGKSNLETKIAALNREIEKLSSNIVRLESQKRSGYEQYVFGKISKEKFLELKQDAENEIEASTHLTAGTFPPKSQQPTM